jgi:Flp pilus assembly protein TadG
MRHPLFRSPAGWPGRTGTAAVEAAFVLPVMLVLLLGLWEMSRAANVSQVLSNAAREAGRQASTNQLKYDQIQTVVTNYLKNAGLTNVNNVRVDIVNLTTNDSGPQTHGKVNGTTVNDYDPTKAAQLNQIQVTITFPFSNAAWGSPRLLTNASTQVTGTSVWVSAQDQSYPGTITAPAGY